MANYRKLIAAIVGLALILAKRQFGFELPGAADLIVEIVLSLGTAVSVWWFRNDPGPQDGEAAAPQARGPPA